MIEVKVHNITLYYRLIALWAVCEAFAGGIMHAAKMPFTGMIVSGLAVTCIILIAFYFPNKSAIIKATVIVALFKLMLSPHSPPTAYIAVFFQGYLGQLLFYKTRNFTFSAIALAVIALVESAIQRLLVLIIIYGTDLWQALDLYIMKVTGGNEKNYSGIAAIAYIIIHAIAGFIIGTFAVKIIRHSGNWLLQYPEYKINTTTIPEQTDQYKRKRNKINKALGLIWLILVMLLIQAYANPADAVLPAGKAAGIIIRSLLIVLSWYILIAPLCLWLIKRFIQSKQKMQSGTVKIIWALIPETRYIFMQSWKLSATETGIGRIRLFIKIIILNIV